VNPNPNGTEVENGTPKVTADEKVPEVAEPEPEPKAKPWFVDSKREDAATVGANLLSYENAEDKDFDNLFEIMGHESNVFIPELGELKSLGITANFQNAELLEFLEGNLPMIDPEIANELDFSSIKKIET